MHVTKATIQAQSEAISPAEDVQTPAFQRDLRLELIPALLIAVFLLGLVLRLFGLDAHGLWHDEVISVQVAQRGPEAIFSERFGWISNQTLLYYLMLWVMLIPADPTTTAVFVRLPQALVGALVPLFVYGIGRHLFGRAQGLFAALLTALSAPLLNYSQDARPYAMLLFFTVAAIFCLLQAERTNLPKWWLAFATAVSFNLLISYVSLTLALPTILPVFVWALWSVWRQHSRRFKPLLPALLSLGLVAIVAFDALLDLTRLARTSPDWSEISVEYIVTRLIVIFTIFMRFGMEQQIELYIALAAALFFVFGFYIAVRQKGMPRRGALICLAAFLIPAFILIVLGTSGPIFSRYILFIFPFYFLLLSHGVCEFALSAFSMEFRPSGIRLLKLTALVLVGVMLVPFLIGVYQYNSPNGHSRLSLRQDYRGAASYLVDESRPGDIILFVGVPMHGLLVSDFYWHGKPPVPAFDAIDGRIFSQSPDGDIFWVLSLPGEHEPLTEQLPGSQQGWVEMKQFESVIVLRENSRRSVQESVEKMVSWLENGTYDAQDLIASLRGGLYQVQGDIDDTVRTYRTAVSSPTTWEENLRSAKGFAALGRHDDAWYWALVSKFEQPGRPEVHRFLAQEMERQGYADESLTERRIADELEATP